MFMYYNLLYMFKLLRITLINYLIRLLYTSIIYLNVLKLENKFYFLLSVLKFNCRFN